MIKRSWRDLRTFTKNGTGAAEKETIEIEVNNLSESCSSDSLSDSKGSKEVVKSCPH